MVGSLRSKSARDAVHTTADRPRHLQCLVGFVGGLLAHLVSYYLLYMGASEFKWLISANLSGETSDRKPVVLCVPNGRAKSEKGLETSGDHASTARDGVL
jgi:hypothetical protein